MAMTVEDLLANAGLARERVILMRHAPNRKEQPKFRRSLIDLACHDRELFEFYQSFQTRRNADRIGSEGYLVSTLPKDGDQAILYSVYKILGPERTVTADELMAELPMQDLLKRGLKPISCAEHDIIRFERTALLHDLAGRVSFAWSSPRTWCRKTTARDLSTPVVVHETSLLGKNCG